MEGLKAHPLAVRILPDRRQAVRDGDLRFLRMDDANHGCDRRRQQFRHDCAQLVGLFVRLYPAIGHRLEAGRHRQVANTSTLDRALPLHRVPHKAPVGDPIRGDVRVRCLHILHQIRPVTDVVEVVGIGVSSALNARLVLSASSSCVASGKPSKDENQALFQGARRTRTFPASAWAENGENRVTLSPDSGVALALKPASRVTRFCTCDLPAWPGSCGSEMATSRPSAVAVFLIRDSTPFGDRKSLT
ncbi:hypothetical protein D9M70_512990 [compost metagenome]